MDNSLKPYFTIADTIAKTFAPYCEVAIHDLRQPQNSVVYVANGTVTGRKPGQSFEHLIKEVLLSKDFHDDYVVNYTFETADKRQIKSSSALIRDTRGEVIGLFCINYDLTLPLLLQQQLACFIPVAPAPEATVAEDVTPVNEVEKIIKELIKNIIGNTNVAKLKRKDNLEIIAFMDKKGIFLVKGSIDKVAEALGISKVTVYSYLDAVRNRKPTKKS